MKKLFRFFLYPYQKKKLLLQSLFLIWIIRLSLWIFPFKWLNKRLSYFGLLPPNSKDWNWEIIDNIVSSVRATSKYVPYASCLTQAFTARILLNMNGQNSELKIGIDKNEQENFAAHAWLEINGEIIIGKLPRHKQRFAILNSSNSVVI